MFQLLLSRAELAKRTPSILMDSYEYTFCPGLSVLFYMAQLIRSEFLKILFLS